MRWLYSSIVLAFDCVSLCLDVVLIRYAITAHGFTLWTVYVAPMVDDFMPAAAVQAVVSGRVTYVVHDDASIIFLYDALTWRLVEHRLNIL